MIIVVGDGPPRIDDLDNFRAFKLVCRAVDYAPLLERIGRLDEQHVWIDQAWLRRNGRTDEVWKSGLEKMIDYAARSGWVDESGAIRAHLEFDAS